MFWKLFSVIILGVRNFRVFEILEHLPYLTIDSGVVNTLFTAQVQSDLYKLSAEAAVEHYSISVDKCDNLEIVCTRCL